MTTTMCSVVVVAFSGVLVMPAMAGDCMGVRFNFTNKSILPAKVKNIEITGNDGNWTEDIWNHTLEYEIPYTTDKRRLNKLDSGKEGTFKVNYDKQKCTASTVDDNGYLVCGRYTWTPTSHTFTLRCRDDMTIFVDLY